MKGGYTTFAVAEIALNTLAAKKNVSALALITSAVAPITHEIWFCYIVLLKTTPEHFKIEVKHHNQRVAKKAGLIFVVSRLQDDCRFFSLLEFNDLNTVLCQTILYLKIF